MIRTSTFAALVLAALGVATVAQADDDVPHALISTHGADLAAPHAVAVLQAQLRRTAAAICTIYGDGSARMARDERACYDVAVSNGMAQIEARHQLALARLSHDAVAANMTPRPTH